MIVYDYNNNMHSAERNAYPFSTWFNFKSNAIVNTLQSIAINLVYESGDIIYSHKLSTHKRQSLLCVVTRERWTCGPVLSAGVHIIDTMLTTYYLFLFYYYLLLSTTTDSENMLRKNVNKKKCLVVEKRVSTDGRRREQTIKMYDVYVVQF